MRNKRVIRFGMVACLMIFPLAFICGPLRGIPFYLQLIDCSCGVPGIIPLWLAYREVQQIKGIPE